MEFTKEETITADPKMKYCALQMMHSTAHLQTLFIEEIWNFYGSEDDNVAFVGCNNLKMESVYFSNMMVPTKINIAMDSDV